MKTKILELLESHQNAFDLMRTLSGYDKKDKNLIYKAKEHEEVDDLIQNIRALKLHPDELSKTAYLYQNTGNLELLKKIVNHIHDEHKKD